MIRNKAHLLLTITSAALLYSTAANAEQTYTYQGHEITKQQAEALMIFNEGYNAVQKNNYPEAAKKLDQALQLDPSLYNARVNYGYVLSKMGRMDESIEQLKKAVEINPTGVEGLSTLASSYQAAGKFDEAIEAYQRALKAAPKHELAPMMASVIEQLKKQRAKVGSVKPSAQDANDYFAFATTDGASHWDSKKMPLKVFIPADADCASIKNFRPAFNVVLKQAFEDWERATNGLIKFAYVDKAAGADIDVTWIDDPSKVKAPSEGGESRVSYDPVHGISRSKILLLTKMPDAIEGAVHQNTIKYAAMHEVGHSLGILGHSPDPKDVMFCSIPASVEDCHVTARDGNTLARIYNSRTQTQDIAETVDKAMTFGKSGKYAEAAPLFKEAIEFLEEAKDRKNLITMLRNYAVCLRNLHRTAEAQEASARADKLAAQK